MPYFAWQGIGLSGKIYRGKRFARSPLLLDEQLFKQDIALLLCNQTSTLWLPRIKRSDVNNFFERLTALLGSGVLLPDALVMLADYSSPVRLQLVIEHLILSINEGHSFSRALENYPSVFDPLSIRLVAVGQEAGKLSATLAALIAHQYSLQEFRKKMRSAALMPLVSFAFFIAVCVLVIGFLLPRLVAMTGLAEQQLPVITRNFLWLTSSSCVVPLLLLFGVLASLVFALRYWLAKTAYRTYKDAVILTLPIVSSITIASQMGWFWSSVALLLRNGVAVVPALTMSKQMIGNRKLQAVMQEVINKVAGGSSISQALAHVHHDYCWPEVVAIIQVGSETGTLAKAIEKGATLYHTEASRRLTLITTIIQPLLLVILGLLIGLLIISIYAPLLTLSFTVG